LNTCSSFFLFISIFNLWIIYSIHLIYLFYILIYLLKFIPFFIFQYFQLKIPFILLFSLIKAFLFRSHIPSLRQIVFLINPLYFLLNTYAYSSYIISDYFYVVSYLNTELINDSKSTTKLALSFLTFKASPSKSGFSLKSLYI